MNELFVLKIVPGWGNESNAVHPVLLCDETSLVLIDCGFVGSLDLLTSALAAYGVTLARLTHVILTHHDHDHVGTLAALKRINPRIQIIANAAEAPFLDGTAPALRLTQARAIQPSLAAEAQAAGLAFIDLLEQVEPAPVDLQVSDGDVLPFCGGCKVVATPGHTLGHLSFYLPALDTMITGDAAMLESGQLALANPQFAEDLALAEQSFQRILDFNAKTVVCYHGGVL